MQKIIRLDYKTNFMVGLNWSMVASIYVLMASTVPIIAFYVLALLPSLFMELLPYLDKRTNILTSFKLLMVFENGYVVILTILWFCFDMTIENAFLILLIGKPFNLIIRNFNNKYQNLFNLYYGEEAPSKKAKLDKATTRGAMIGCIIGLIFGTFGHSAIIVIFILLEIYSLYVNILLYNSLKTFKGVQNEKSNINN